MDSECSDLAYGAVLQETKFLLTQPLDYEIAGCRITKNHLRDQNGISITFQVTVNNLDDNAPQFKLNNNNCELKVGFNIFFKSFAVDIAIYEVQCIQNKINNHIG